MQLIDPNYRDFDTIRREFRWQVPEHCNIAHQVCDKHTGLASHPAMFYENEQGEEKTYTFGQLSTLSNRFANALRALGVARGDRVGIILPQRIETGIAHLAVYKLGAVALPLSILFGPDAIEYRLSDSGAKAVITLGHHVTMIQDMKQLVPDLQTVISCDESQGDASFWKLIDAAAQQSTPVATEANDPALLIYTSGTTGPPKGALVAHRALLGNLTGFELSQNFFPQPNDVFWTPADWAWTGGLMDGLLPTWYYGKPIVAFEGGKFDSKRACRLMEKYAVTNAFIPPTALKMIRKVTDIERYKFKLRAIMSAGETMGAELYEWGQDALGFQINEMWGQTEFNYLVGNCALIMTVKPGSMGKPYPGHVVSIIDEDGNELPAGENGELAASAGHRVGPGEIEDCLLKHPAVVQAAVIGSPDELRGNIIKAYIVLAEGYAPEDALKGEIQTAVKTRLAAHEYPRAIEFIAEMPMTTTGKVRRVELRRMDQEQQSLKP